MPLPMVHLGIAVQLGDVKGETLSSAFLLGSIAPDAIHMRPNADRVAKQMTHLRMAESDLPERLQAFLEERSSLPENEQSFAAGYVAHILTDALWVTEVVQPFHSQIPATMTKEERRTLYYQETDQVDFNLYHGAPWRETIWHQLKQASAPDLPPLLTAQEITLWQDRTLRWFAELKEEPGIQPMYLTDALVHGFIDRATAHVAAALDDWCSSNYL
ncbi:MAG: zinc dependent phospholipase C family protein [Caldilineaceae bacterium]|nr:zinc dependent phospholipase C family protein [Caldilineaceae bacterium]